jgi:hypothetical protein
MGDIHPSEARLIHPVIETDRAGKSARKEKHEQPVPL